MSNLKKVKYILNTSLKRLKTKIDFSLKYTNEEINSLYNKLKTVEWIFNQKKAFENVDINLIDPHDFVNLDEITNEIVNDFNIDYDKLEQFVNIIKNYKQYLNDEYLKCKAKVETKDVDKTKSKWLLNIVDVDYEYGKEGMTIILYCKDENNQTYTVLKSFDDYFFVECTQEYPQVRIQGIIKRFLEENLLKRLNNITKFNGWGEERRGSHRIITNKEPIKAWELIKGYKSAFGYQRNSQDFLKIVTRYDYITKQIFRVISEEHPKLKFFEVKIDVITKFMTKYDLGCFNTIEVDGKCISAGARNNVTTSDYVIRANDLKLVPDEDERAFQFMPRNMFYDIECLSMNGSFPTSDKCPIFQISVIVAEGSESKVLDKSVLCLKETPGFDSYENESALILAFYRKIKEWDPDFIVGFNSNAFDMPYILDRMKQLNLPENMYEFSRRKGFKVNYKKSVTTSNQKGSRESFTYTIPGRTMVDQMVYAKDAFKLESYSLESIASAKLGKHKVDLDNEHIPEIGYDPNDIESRKKYKDTYALIPPLFQIPKGRAMIAKYCLQDSMLLLELDQKLLFSLQFVEFSKIMGCSLNTTLNRGVVFKLMRKFLEYTQKHKFLIPSFTKGQRPEMPESYAGAIVLPPDTGYHTDAVSVLDFKSLYPSIMRTWNLSFDTYVLPGDEIDETIMEKMPTGYWFVKRSHKEGVLGKFLSIMADQRTLAKKAMKSFPKGSLKYNVYNGKQLAVKVIMNSAYGALGSKTSPLPMANIAWTVTAIGQREILKTKEWVENNFDNVVQDLSQKNNWDDLVGQKNEVKVIYGDTDSVFVKMIGQNNLQRAYMVGAELEHRINEEIYKGLEPMEIEHEKIFMPFLLLKKKKYISLKTEPASAKLIKKNNGRLYTDPELSYSGVEIARRSGSVITREIMNDFVHEYFVNNNEQAALKVVYDGISKLLQSRYALTKFRISTNISKEDYANPPGHIIAWKRMQRRIGKEAAPKVGDRIDYMVAEYNKGKKIGQQFVDWRHSNDIKLTPDLDYYFTASIQKPMDRIMEHLIDESVRRKIFDKTNYDQKVTINANGSNLLGLWNKSSSVTKKRTRESLENVLKTSKKTKQTSIRNFFKN